MRGIYSIRQFKQDIDKNDQWYVQALRGEWKGHQIDYWNFNCCLHPELRPAIVTRDEANTICNGMMWEKACTYKGFIFWVPIS